MFFPMDSVCRLLDVEDDPDLRAEMGEDGCLTIRIVGPDGVSEPLRAATWDGLTTLLRNRPALLIERPYAAEVLNTLEGRDA